jgi:Zn-dependent protease with chaperone function
MLLAVAWLFTYLVHSTVLLGGAWIVTTLRVVRSHDAREVLWKVALLGGIVTASVQTALPLDPVAGYVALSPVSESPLVQARGAGALLAPAAPAGAPAPASPRRPVVLASSGEAGDAAPAFLPAAAAPRFLGSFHAGWPGLALNLWLFGALACAISLFWARAEMRRRLANRRDIADGPLPEMLAELASAARFVGPVRLTVSDTLSCPISFGRSEICLPERAVTGLSPAEQRAVLAHELGHLVRRDPYWQLASAVVAALLFAQPLNRLARRRLQEIAEYLCDDWAAVRTGGGLALAQCLAEVATWMRHGRAPELRVASAMAARPSQLVARVQRLLEGGPRRPARYARAGATCLGIAALGAIAVLAPGVAARDLEALPVAALASGDAADHESERWNVAAVESGDGWLSIRESGRLLVMHPRYTVRLVGAGRLGFREWGRALSLPEGYRVTVDGAAVSGEADVCTDQTVRIVGPDGAVAWRLEPVALEHESHARLGRDDRRELATLSRTLRSLGATRGDLMHDELDSEAEAKLDAAIDTLVRAWARDPAAVRVAAGRIARTFDRDLAPQFESLGVALGEELAPRLERVSSRLGRDLGPEFARLGSELGRTLVAALAETELALDSALGAGAGDYRKPKRNR